MRTKAAAVAALVALAAASCGTASASGVLRASGIDGAVEVRSGAGQEWQPLTEGRALAPDDEVRTATDGVVTLESGETSFDLAPDTWIVVHDAQHVTARTGSLLARSDEEVLADDGSSLRVRGEKIAFRLDYGRRVGVYRGTASVDQAAGRVEVGALRELTLGLSVPDVRVVVIDESDRWDRRYLSDAIQIDQALAPYQRSFDVNAGTTQPTLEFLGRFVDAGAIGFLGPLLPTRLAKAGSFDVLVTLLVGIEHANGSKKPLPDAFGDVLILRELGASFGVAAQSLDVKPATLLKRVLLALDPSAEPQTVAPVKPDGSPGPQPSGGGTGGPSPSPTPTSTRRPTSSPTPTSSPSPTNTTSPSPSPSPSPTCEVVDQLMGRCSPPGLGL